MNTNENLNSNENLTPNDLANDLAKDVSPESFKIKPLTAEEAKPYFYKELANAISKIDFDRVYMNFQRTGTGNENFVNGRDMMRIIIRHEGDKIRCTPDTTDEHFKQDDNFSFTVAPDGTIFSETALPKYFNLEEMLGASELRGDKFYNPYLSSYGVDDYKPSSETHQRLERR